MRKYACLVLAFGLLGCGRPQGSVSSNNVSLAEARQGFTTHLLRSQKADEPVPHPPANLFRLVKFDAPVGKLAAYLTPDPGDGARHPAIIWITGGDCNTIGSVWDPAPSTNDQTASAYRKAGMVMMFPSLRGGNRNPGVREGFFGEVNDVLAAADFLAQQEYVDPARIYLGGHSTGGTLVLLVAEYSDRFRATFSFGPVDDVTGYGPDSIPFNVADSQECNLRAPIRWLHSIKKPVFVLEGVEEPANLDALNAMARATNNPLVQFFPVKGANHFSILARTNQLLAQKILADTGPEPNLSLNRAELDKLFAK